MVFACAPDVLINSIRTGTNWQNKKKEIQEITVLDKKNVPT